MTNAAQSPAANGSAHEARAPASENDALTTYRFNTNAVPHYFCSICGIYTHHQRRSDSTQCGVNVACLAGISPFDFPELPVNDGVDHPADAGRSAGTRIAGHLRYVPSDPGNTAD